MCSVSAIYDYGRSIPVDQWTIPGWQQFQPLIEQAKKFDAANGEPDCEDPGKAEWMREMEQRIERLEAEAFRKATP